MTRNGVTSSRRGDALRRFYYLCSALLVDPRRLAASWRAIPWYLRNAMAYWRATPSHRFPLRFRDFYYTTPDRFLDAGTARGHYFHQDLWAARWLNQRRISQHVDVGSRVDGFVAHVLAFAQVTYVDIRPLPAVVPGLTVQVGSLLALPFADQSLPSLSCLHVIEHIGLGRYGDQVDPAGFARASQELARVLAPGGHLLIGTPVGRERLCFDAHRIFDPVTVVEVFRELDLVSFSLIDDAALEVQSDASFEAARQCVYGCGLFVFARGSLENRG